MSYVPPRTMAEVPTGRKWQIMAAISTAYEKRAPFDPANGIIPEGGGLWPWIDAAAEEIMKGPTLTDQQALALAGQIYRHLGYQPARNSGKTALGHMVAALVRDLANLP